MNDKQITAEAAYLMRTAKAKDRSEHGPTLAVEWNRKARIWYVHTIDGIRVTTSDRTCAALIREALRRQNGGGK